MFDPTNQTTPAQTPYLEEREAASYGTILAKTMGLVAAALALFTAGAFLGQDIEFGTARFLGIAGAAMLFGQSFVSALRTGTVGTAWLFVSALLLGLGFGPVLEYYVSTNPDAIASAAGMTGVIVLGAATAGTFTSHDLARWMRPVSLIVFGAALLTWIFAAFSADVPVLLSAVIGIFSAALIVLYFNYLRRHATEDDTVWLATGIFVAIINIFFSLLNIGRD